MADILENPRGGCVLAGIASVLEAMHRICPIYHSGPGCCMQTTASEQGQSGHKSSCFVSGVSIPSSNMLEREVVFGGIEKLKTTVQGSIDIIDADAYFILTGCTAGIIGDDVSVIAEQFREEGYPVYAIDSPGFVGDSNLGYEIVWTQFIKDVIEQSEVRDEKLVNIFGIIPYHDPFWSGNLEEIKRLLEALGLKVNTFYTGHQGIEDVKKCSKAALNLIINPWLFKGNAEKFEKKFGVPSLRIDGLPVGASDTTAFLRKLAKTLNDNAGREIVPQSVLEAVIEKEEDYVYSYLEQAIGALSWKRFAIAGEANIAIGLTRYLANDYSFSPVLAIITDPVKNSEDKERIVKQITDLEYARPPKVIFLTDQYEINKALMEEEEDISLIMGSSNEREAALKREVQYLYTSFPMNERLIFNRSYAGYRGSLTFTEDLYDNL
ncbi:MAG: nitrogen fixation protein NifK [Lachnospiraceae bacterium]|nr:nitrogen fixation protein NifK [Lachnospiraceae bacterium]